MRSYQDIIDEQLQIVEKGNEIITSEEFYLMCIAEKDMIRPPGEHFFSKYRDLNSLASKAGSKIATILTIGIYGWWRKITDKCQQRCKTVTPQRLEYCIATCNMNGARSVLDMLKKKRKELNDIEDPKLRQEAKAALDKEEEKWMDRFGEYRDALQAAHASATVSFDYTRLR